MEEEIQNKDATNKQNLAKLPKPVMNQVHAMCEPGYLENYELIEQGDSHYEVITNFLCDRCLLHLAMRRVLSLLYRWCSLPSNVSSLITIDFDA